MLLTKEAFVKLNNCNIGYYENLGYNIPRYFDKRGRKAVKRGTTILVKVEDLSIGSIAFVSVECDGCHSKKNIKWFKYKKIVKDDGSYYCKRCTLNGYNKWVSFEEWCLENNRKDVLKRWDYKLNNCTPDQITCYNNNKFYFLCPLGIHKSEEKRIEDFCRGHNKTIQCKACDSFAQWGLDNLSEDFLEKYWDYDKNTFNPWKLSKCSGKNIWVKCQKKNYHGSYITTPNEFAGKNKRCSFCSNKKVHYNDSLGALFPETINLWSNKNNNTPYDYKPYSGEEVWWKCENAVHEDYLRNITDSNSRCQFRCPSCVNERKESFLQEKVRLYLNELNFNILHEHSCTLIPINPKTKMNMPYDNEIVELKLIVEVHGVQHYKENTGFWFNKNFDFHKRKLYDRYKRIFAKSKSYEYLEIPYWTDDKDETWKKLIDNKINNIN